MYRVVIEFKRIQTYVFAVSRLRTILGANALIGETLRIRLPRLAKDAAWPASLTAPDFPTPLKPDADDPLRGSVGSLAAPSDWAVDDPAASYRQGVLTRDGGHFCALFADRTKAISFGTQARDLIARVLPGLLADVRVEHWRIGGDGTGIWAALPAFESTGAETVLLYEPPGREICELSGRLPATTTIHEGRRALRVSAQVKGQWLSGKRFSRGKSADIVGLLQRQRSDGKAPLLPCFDKGWNWPNDLQDVAGGPGRYLAVIHLDGNSVGNRTPKHDGPATLQEWLNAEAKVEAFFHSMRSAVRAATVEALRQTFGALAGKQRFRPYQLMMLGGDDLLLIMAAEHAPGFVVNQARALEGRKLSDDKPLDIGVGVAIARPTFPFHRLHALAEELAASAKRLARGKQGAGRSVVDWMVLTQSAALGVAEQRRLHEQVSYRVGDQTERLLLTAKPYFVLRPEPNAGAEHPAPADTLEGLLDLAGQLRDARQQAARSQRKALPELLRVGREAGQMALDDWLDDLPPVLRATLKKRGLGKAWERPRGEQSPLWMTRALDLAELAEIPDLGRRPAPAHTREEAA